MPRKSRYSSESVIQSRYKTWKVAVYVRLSKEDARCFDESESITNQRAIIEDHLSKMDDGDEYIVVGEYVDDGISGTTDDEREQFQRMLNDIRKGRINCVIVKDLARSFRNYSDQGYYLDDWFPRYNVRFISLFHQPLDSYRDPKNMRSIAVPIQGVLNENHCAETSDKIREVFDIKRRQGKHIGSFALYGYLKDPNDKNAFIVDEYAASVVRDIFSMFLDGMSKNAIVRHLNDHGILCPSLYKQQVLGMKYQNPWAAGRKPLWAAITITNILKNRMYCGDMVQGRYRIKSYKVHVQEVVPADEWYIVENTHEAIIDRETFDKAQLLLHKDTRAAPNSNQVYLFSGFLRCGDCGKSMSRSKVKNYVYYFCRTYKDQSKGFCTKHTIRHDQLEAAVLRAIQEQIYLAVDCTKVIEQINRTPVLKNQSQKLNSAIEKKNQDLAKLTRYKQALYQDWKDGEISRSDYQNMRDDYERQIDEITEVLSRLENEQRELEAGVTEENPFLEAFRQHQNIQTLTRDVLIELVDHITIYEGGNIRITFRFADERRKVQEYIGINTNSAAV